MTESNDELRPEEGVETAAAPESAEPAPETVEIEATPETAEPETTSVESSDTEVVASDSDGPSEVSAEDAATEVDATADGAEMKKALENSNVEQAPRKGKRVQVKLIQIGDDNCFVDYGGRSEGAIATTELKDKEGKLRHQLGDSFSAVVKSTGDPLVFTLGRKGTPANVKKLQEAFEAGVPVEGTVKSTNKGGFEVNIGGARAFCPFSQIERGYCKEPEQYVGKKLPFAITTFERGGRNVVVSHRKILEQEASASADETRKNLEVGQVMEGIVRRLQPYGAFIDIGGLDGLVHVSQIQHGHVRDPKDVLSIGESVKVKILKIDGAGTDKERISLSIKDLQDDPWAEIEAKLPAGGIAKGKVVRITDFGAFVELLPGIDGLIHISQIATHRVGHPSEELTVGQEVEARVLSVDAQTQKISLSLKPEGSDPPARHEGGSRPSRDRNDRPRGKKGRRGENDFPSEYRSAPTEKANSVDVSGMEFDDALEVLRRKFQGGA